MNETASWQCPLCDAIAAPDERRPVEIAGLVFQSVTCAGAPVGSIVHPFPNRWLETIVARPERAARFERDFEMVAGPLPSGSPIEEAFGDSDPVLAWVETRSCTNGMRVLIRL